MDNIDSPDYDDKLGAYTSANHPSRQVYSAPVAPIVEEIPTSAAPSTSTAPPASSSRVQPPRYEKFQTEVLKRLDDQDDALLTIDVTLHTHGRILEKLDSLMTAIAARLGIEQPTTTIPPQTSVEIPPQSEQIPVASPVSPVQTTADSPSISEQIYSQFADQILQTVTDQIFEQIADQVLEQPSDPDIGAESSVQSGSQLGDDGGAV